MIVGVGDEQVEQDSPPRLMHGVRRFRTVGARSQRPRVPARTHALRQRLVHEHKPELVLAGVNQLLETCQFPEYKQHAREGLERDAGIAAFETFDGRGTHSAAFSERRLSELAATACPGEVLSELSHGASSGDRQGQLDHHMYH